MSSPHKLKEKLTLELDQAQWRDLKVHSTREALIWVSQELNIVDVGVEIANDQISLVSKWLEEGKIFKPDSAKITSLDTEPDHSFNFLIISPYVLIQELLH